MTRYLLCMIALAALPAALVAESRALLVAVSNVPARPEINPLQGPDNDVAALRRALIDDWGFRAERLSTLRGTAATRTAILAALDRLVEETGPGDRVLVYFSGHGVSAHDLVTGGYGMRPDTGALVPADLQPGTPEETLAGLIVGSRDLRPRFERLDRAGAETLVLFDACYAGESARSPPGLVPRSAKMFSSGTPAERAFEKEFMRSLASAASRWPYERVIYIAASARHELAWDIPADMARRERPTIDGEAHGAFTNGLLLALRGDADRDRDGRIVYSELREYLVGSLVSQRDSQTPQLYPASGPIAEMPVLGRSVVPARPDGAAAPHALRVRLEAAAPGLAALLSREDGVVLTDGEYDVEVRWQEGRFRTFLASGAALGVRLEDSAAVAALLRRRAQARRIVNLEYRAQDMRLEIFLEPEQGGVYRRDETVSVGIRPGAEAWLLLLAIDPGGGVIPVYPFDRSQARRVRARETVRAVDLAAVAPFGTDLLEAFAFRDKPDGYENWIGRTEPLSESETRRLYEALRERADAPGRAKASRVVFTVNR